MNRRAPAWDLITLELLLYGLLSASILCGIILIAVGVKFMKFKWNIVQDLYTEELPPEISTYIHVSSIFTIVLVVLGSIAIYRRHKFHIILFSIFLIFLIMFELELIPEITPSLVRHNVAVARGLNRIFLGHNRSWEDIMILDHIQSKMFCCGVNSTFDYTESDLPQSCCLEAASVCDYANSFATGCLWKISSYFAFLHRKFTWVLCFKVIFELLALVNAMFYLINFDNIQINMNTIDGTL